MIHMLRLFLADVPDSIALFVAYRLPRRVVYWAGIRMMAEASQKLPHAEVPALTPADILKAWRAR